MKVPPFIRKLKLILQTISPEIAGWNEDGNMFEVCDAKSFAVELSRHFKGNEQTFIRQLHFYGFTKLDCTRNLRKLEKPLPPALPGAWSFSHPLLLRDSLDLMDSIVRNSDKRPGGQGASAFDSNEDFEEEDNIGINSREWSQMRKRNKDLEAAVEALQAKLAILTNFLEKEGYDPQALVSSSVPLRKKTKTVLSFDMDDAESGDESISKKRDREDFELPPSFQRQTSLDLFFQSASASSSSISSSSSIDEVQGAFPSIFDDQQFVSHNAPMDFGMPSAFVNNNTQQLPKPIQSSAIDALADTLSRNISFDSGLGNVINGHLPTNDETMITMATCAFEAENLQIDSETVSKVVMHLKEALRAAMNAEIACDSSCAKLESNDAFNNFQVDSSLPTEEELKTFSLSPAPSLMASSLTPSTASGDTKKLIESCEELRGKSMSILLPLLLSLPQIRAALRVNDVDAIVSESVSSSRNYWGADSQLNDSVSAS